VEAGLGTASSCLGTPMRLQPAVSSKLRVVLICIIPAFIAGGVAGAMSSRQDRPGRLIVPAPPGVGSFLRESGHQERRRGTAGGGTTVEETGQLSPRMKRLKGC
jgi:hypothetical protein